MRVVRFYFGQAVSVAELVRELLESEVIGGATVTHGNGFWRSPDTGVVHIEDCTILMTTFSRDAELNALKAYARYWAERAGEESVMIEVDGKAAFLDTGVVKTPVPA